MKALPFPLDHIGIAVENLEASISYYRDTFGFALDIRELVPSQKVEVAFVSLANTKIELLAATDSDSTLAKFLRERGPGLHHICYRVPNIEVELARLKAAGIRLIDEKPRPGAHHTRIAFLHPKSTQGVLTELCQANAP
ncbi:MAG: methylmalonyl-CoA epimerase [Oligoflexia bacterium]|nr:methylmalonyl-CoA epimerase [Oligoflexia bacterium]